MSPIVFSFVLLLCIDVACAQSPALEPVTIQLRWFHQFQFAGYYAAIEKGFYAEEGLEVALRKFEPGKDRIAPVLEGRAQYGIGDPSLLKLRMEGKPVVVLAQIFQHSPQVLIARRDSGIYEPPDLVGKKVMIPQDDLGTAPVHAMLLDALGGLDGVSVIPHTFNMDNFKAGKTDAMTGYLSNEPFRLKQDGVAVNIMDARTYGIDFYGDNLFTTEQEIDAHPVRVKKVLRATLKGWAYALQHKDEIIDLIIEKYNPDLDRDQLHYEAKVVDQMIVPDLVPVGEVNPKRYERIAKTYKRLGMSTTSTVPEGFIYQEGTEQAIALTHEERAWLAAHPEIVLGYTDTLEPEVIANPDGTHSGMLVDFLDALNKRLGIEIGLRLYPIPEVIDKAKKKIVDGIPNLHPEYADRLGLIKTRVYWPAYLAVFAHKGVSFRSPEDFADKRVAIIDKVHITEKFMDQHGKLATILKVADALEGLQSVEKGAADFFLGFSYNSFFIPKYQLFRVVPTHVFIDSPEWFTIGIRADWPILVSILNKGIASFSRNEINTIITKWSYLPQKPEAIKLTAEERDWLSKDYTVRVRISEHEPYLFSKSGKAVGIVVDLLNTIAEHTGVKFNFTKRTHALTEAMQRLVKHDGIDIIPSLNPTPERQKIIAFTKPYVTSPKFIFTRDDAPFIFSMANLSGKTVAVIEGYVTHQLLVKNYPEINLLIYKSNKDALTAVSSGKAFAFIGSLLSTATMINKYGLPNLKASAPSDLPEATVAMGVRKDWPELRDIINKGYDAIPEREKFAIINKWSPVNVEYGIRPSDVLKWFLVVGGSAFGILLLFVFWNWNLRRQVHLRTAELDSSIQSLRAEIAERKQAEGERDRILNSSHDLICIAGMDGYFKYINPAWEKTLGYTQHELLNKPFRNFIHPDDHPKNDAEIEKLAAGQNTLDFENRYIHKDGTVRHISWVATPLTDENLIYCIGRDVTRRKEKEQKILEYQQRLKTLATRLTFAEERERRSIAADLHDHVGHSLALARLQLNGVLEAQSELERTILVKDISHILLKSLQDTRNLIFELSSPSLNEIGLGAAVSEWLEEHAEKRYGLKTQFIDEIDERLRKTLDDNVRAVLFRNVRELVTNVIKHAKAQKVSIYLKNVDTMLTIIIEDDGAGFDTKSAIEPGEVKSGFGLFSIKERMADLGGSFDIRSEPGKGCRVVLTVPVSGEVH
jgi:two-component system sensor histidine kinase EvgS